jgi:hypothetical protein
MGIAIILLFFTVLLFFIFRRTPPLDLQYIVVLSLPFIIVSGVTLAILHFALNSKIWIIPLWSLLFAGLDWNFLLWSALGEMQQAEIKLRRAQNMPGYNDLYIRKNMLIGAALDDIEQFKFVRLGLLLLPLPLSGIIFIIYYYISNYFPNLVATSLYEPILWSLGSGFTIVDILCLIRMYHIGYNYDNVN